jgi:hypothetical protein
VRPCVVSYLDAKATQFAMAEIYFFQEKYRNLNLIAGLQLSAIRVRSLPIRCNKPLFLLPSLLISCSVTARTANYHPKAHLDVLQAL